MSNTENFLEIEAKTIDEAIFKGLEQLGLAFDEATIDILEEGSKGFLGLGGRLAKVRLTRRDALKEESGGSVKPQAENEQKASNKPEKHASPKAFSGAQAVSQPKMENISALCEGQPLDNTHPAMLFLKGLLDSMKIEGSLKGVQTQDGIYRYKRKRHGQDYRPSRRDFRRDAVSCFSHCQPRKRGISPRYAGY